MPALQSAPCERASATKPPGPNGRRDPPARMSSSATRSAISSPICRSRTPWMSIPTEPMMSMPKSLAANRAAPLLTVVHDDLRAGMGPGPTYGGSFAQVAARSADEPLCTSVKLSISDRESKATSVNQPESRICLSAGAARTPLRTSVSTSAGTRQRNSAQRILRTPRTPARARPTAVRCQRSGPSGRSQQRPDRSFWQRRRLR